MRICILAATYPVVTQTFVYEPARWLAEAGHDVSVLAHRSGELPGRDEAVRPARIVGGLFGWEALRAALRAPRAIASAIADGRRLRDRAAFSLRRAVVESLLPEVRDADCLLAHFGTVGLRWLPVAAMARRPLAVYFHGFDASAVLQRTPGRYDSLFASGAALLTNSEYLAVQLTQAGAPVDRLTVVPIGVEPSIASLSIAPENRRIVTVARLVPKKGLDDALRAFATLQRRTAEPWEYEIVGDGPLRQDLERMAVALGVGGAVRFHGFLPRRAAVEALRRASVFLLASRVADNGDSEGTPVSILEAATLGLPVIATHHAGIPEILPPEAASQGFLVPEGDVAGLTAALLRLANSDGLRRLWGEACARHVRARHAAGAHVAALTDALARGARVPTFGAGA